MDPSPARNFRIRQIRLCTNLALGLARSPTGWRIVKAARSVPGLVPLLVGYRRIHPTLAVATAAVQPFENGGHVNPVNAVNHLSLSERARISDYPALLHIERRITNIKRVFDLGGNVGNLYYGYTQYLTFPDGIEWIVQDLPGHIARGRELAESRGVTALKFTDSLTAAEGADLFIASGCLHYFENSLPEMLTLLKAKPAFVLVNRTPMTDGDGFATVQEAFAFRVPCRIDNRAKLIEGMQQIGYKLADRWEAKEMQLEIPFYSDVPAPYSGFFFERG